MSIKKYITLTKAGMMEALQFRLGIIVLFLGNILYLFIVYYLWKAIYASSGKEIVNGMTFSDTLIYLVLATALFNFMEMYTVWDMGSVIQSGKIVLELVRPMKYRSYLFWSYSGALATNFFLTFLPTFIVVVFLTFNTIHIGINLLFFVVSVIMAVSINYSIDFFVGTICIYTESVWGINIMKQVIVLLFSGATIPLAFFPEMIKRIACYLPFQAIYNAPLTILLGKNSDLKEILLVLGNQFVWCIVTLIISKLFWNISIRQITVNGG